MNVTTEHKDGVAVVRIGETRLMYPLLADFSGAVGALLEVVTAGPFPNHPTELLSSKALAQLPPTLRSAVLLRDIQELTYQEIAGRLSLPEGTVKSRINRGRTELARQIKRLRHELEAGVAG